MTYAMAMCPVHGQVPATAIGPMGPWTSGQTFVNSSQTCPVQGCNRRAVILDAVYTAAPDGRLMAAPATPLGEYQFAQLRRTLENVRRQVKRDIDPATIVAEFRAEVQKAAPQLEPVLDAATRTFRQRVLSSEASALYGLIAVLVAIVQIFLGNADNSSDTDFQENEQNQQETGRQITEEEIDRLIEEKLRELQGGAGKTTEPASPSPSAPPPGPEQQPPTLKA